MKNILKTASFLACSLAILASPMFEASESFAMVSEEPRMFGKHRSTRHTFGRISDAKVKAPVASFHAKDYLTAGGCVYLDCRGIRSIDQVDFTGLVTAEMLSLAGNELKSVDGLPDIGIPEINLGGNKIEDSSLIWPLPGIKKLNLGGNRLTSIKSFPYCEDLVDLNISCNNLTDLEKTGYISLNLTTLNVSDNQLIDFSKMFWGRDHIVNLKASHNKISTLKDLGGVQVLRR